MAIRTSREMPSPNLDSSMTKLSPSNTTSSSDSEAEHLEELRRSEERYRALIEATTQAVWSWNPEKGTSDFERAQVWWEQLTGQTLQEQKAKENSWLDVIHPDDRAATAAAWTSSIATGKIYDVEYRVRGREGEWRYVRARGVPVRDPEGVAREWVGTLDDITDLRMAAEERERFLAMTDTERRRLEEVFRHAPTFIAVLRGPNHVFERVNERYTELIGGRDVIGKPVREALPEIEGQGYLELLDRVYRTGQPHIGLDARVKIQRGDSLTERILEFVYQPMLDTAGIVSGIILQGVDLTERRLAERELVRLTEESERRRRVYETILSNTPDLAYVFDLQHRFVYANEQLLRMWGKTWDEAIGKNCLELGYEDWHAAMHDREIEQVRATGKPIRGEVPFNGTNGRRIYDYIFVPVFGEDGEVEAVAGTTRDVTERQQAEEALRESDRRKDDFLALLAHELRNPLAPIRNGLQVIRLAERDPESVSAAREMMDRQLSHMVRLIDDLLDVSRITRNKMELRRSNITLADVIGSAVEAAGPSIDEFGHELTVRLPQEPIHLHADLTRLAQVFSNLLCNSAKYTSRGGKIWLSAELANKEIVVSVRDTGIGIPASALPTIFDMFSQVDRSIERNTGGLGIGLALVKGLVEMHGGVVVAESIESQGSTFTVRLPVTVAVTEAIENSPESAREDQLPRLRVLVVDDNQDGAASMAMMLRLLGNDVTMAHDGLEAVAAAGAMRPDVILMDIGLPRLNGLDATRQIRDQAWGKSVQIIALTGWGQESDRELSHSAGCNGHLVKPVQLCDLEQVLTLVRKKKEQSL